MTKRILLLAVVFIMIALGSSASLALDFMGPPTPDLKQGQFSAGLDYTYSEMNLKFNENKTNWQYYRFGVPGNSGVEKLPSKTVKNFRTNKIFAHLGYGLTDNWDVFLRLGATNVDFKTDELFDDDSSPQDVHGDTDFAIGFGTKATFYQNENWQLGGVFQMSWAKSGENTSGGDPAELAWYSAVDAEITEIQIALGPTFWLNDHFCIYGGPFFHFVDGDINGKLLQTWPDNGITDSYTEKLQWDINEASFFGGYVGGQINITENASLCIEYLHTAFADAIGMNVLWKL